MTEIAIFWKVLYLSVLVLKSRPSVFFLYGCCLLFIFALADQ